MAVTAVALMYQCALTTRIARGRGTDSPKPRQAAVYRLSESAFIGLPCPKNAAGISASPVGPELTPPVETFEALSAGNVTASSGGLDDEVVSGTVPRARPRALVVGTPRVDKRSGPNLAGVPRSRPGRHVRLRAQRCTYGAPGRAPRHRGRAHAGDDHRTRGRDDPGRPARRVASGDLQ